MSLVAVSGSGRATLEAMPSAGPIPLARPRQGRLIAGVCAGLEPALGVPVGLIRFAFLLGALAGGVGAAAYVAAVVLLPETDAAPPAIRRREPIELAAIVSIIAGGFLACRASGVWLADVVGFPGAVAAAGVALVWGRAEGRTAILAGRGGPLRIAIGVTLVVGGGAAFLAATGDVGAIGRSLALGGVIVVGLLLMTGPAVGRLVGALRLERRQRIRSEERSEISAHLHDSVLQTLALIQVRAGDDREVQRLARRQERELRAWLQGKPPEAAATTLADLLASMVADIEDDHAVRVELVAVGDAPLDDRLTALALAGREALLNAARHAGVATVDAYLEVEPHQVTLFVRDRGKGFDPTAVDPDRRGLAESIHGRMTRSGGRAEVRSSIGEGTEVELVLPRPT
jgi:phage shock protein PspC (stress-responsive transcriptional regulator)/anti-sigma regulatory factor (Ser/Thr protein kinase)